MLYCPECGATNEDTARSCIQCGKPLPDIKPVASISKIYCPNCGAVNSDQARECVQCKTALPKLDTSVSAPPIIPPPPPITSSQLTFPTASSESFWQKLSPDWRSALLTSFVVSGLQALSSVIPGIGFVLSLPFAITSYYVQGILTGKYAKNDSRYSKLNPSGYARLGATSGFWTSGVIATVLILIVIAAQFALTLGGAVAIIPIILVNRLLDIFLNVSFSAIGAWLYGRTGGKGVVGISIGVVGCGIVLACLLSILLLMALASIGINLYQNFFG